MLLAVDTSSASVTVAVADGAPGRGGRVLASGARVDAGHHAELLSPLVQQVCREAGVLPAALTTVAVGVGPGPFTGLRIGIVTARALAVATGAASLGVCSLDVLAAGAGPVAVEFLAVADARRREVYWARYAVVAGRPQRVAGPAVDQPAAVPGAAYLPAVGHGAVLYPDVFTRMVDGAPVHPDAAVLAAAVMDGTVELLPTDPLYLRRPDARPAAPRE